MGLIFHDEAKKLLNLEFGRASIPTVQALCAMYLAIAVLGRDREAIVFRFMALEMTARLELDKKYYRLRDDDPDDLVEKHVISRTLWAVFCFERYLLDRLQLAFPSQLTKYLVELHIFTASGL